MRPFRQVSKPLYIPVSCHHHGREITPENNLAHLVRSEAKVCDGREGMIRGLELFLDYSIENFRGEVTLVF